MRPRALRLVVLSSALLFEQVETFLDGHMITQGRAQGREPGNGSHGALPESREAVLGVVSSWRQRVYELAREIVDSLETAAPWSLLYYPSEDGETFLSTALALEDIVAGIPSRVSELVELVGRDLEAQGKGKSEEIDFCFAGIHGVLQMDLERLTNRLDTAQRSEALSEAERDEICEICADLKGKYSSAVMGAAANIVGEGRWRGLDIEPVLFPEKTEELHRNVRLLTSLKRLVDAAKELSRSVPFGELLERWQIGQRVDPYVLADLTIFQGRLRKILQSDSRRALYSGDYHQLRRREVRLSACIRELESLHAQTWHGSTRDPGEQADAYGRMCLLVLEIAAFLDAEILRRLMGNEALEALREVSTSGRKRRVRGTLGWHLDGAGARAVASALADDDLRTFLELLMAVVRKRASLSGTSMAEPAAVTTETGTIVLRGPSRSGEVPGVGADEDAASPSLSSRKGRRAVKALSFLLDEVRSSSNSRWNSFRLVLRLVEQHARVPASMADAARPFLEEVKSTLVPQLKQVVCLRGLPDVTEERLSQVLRFLQACDLEEQRDPDRLGQTLRRTSLALEGLSTGLADLGVGEAWVLSGGAT